MTAYMMDFYPISYLESYKTWILGRSPHKLVDRPTWTFDDHNYLIKGPQNLTAIHTLEKH